MLYMLARSCRARTIVEFGTSFGISTLHLAAALRDNGGGHLITSEFEPSKAARAKQYLTSGGLTDLVEFREADALRTLSVDLPETIDLLLLDGAKAHYPEILSLVESQALVALETLSSYPYFERYREQSAVAVSTSAFVGPVPFSVALDASAGAKTARVFGHLVSPEYFTTAGVEPAMGRFFRGTQRRRGPRRWR